MKDPAKAIVFAFFIWILLAYSAVFAAGGGAASASEEQAKAPQEILDRVALGGENRLPAGPLFLIPNDLVEISTLGVVVIHDYGQNSLALVPNPELLPPAVRNRITALDDATTLTYRSWKGPVSDFSEGAVVALPDGYHLMALIGPADESWSRRFALFGVTVVDTASPYGLVVHGNGEQLLRAARSTLTSHGYPVVRGIAPIPLETRLSGELLRVVKGQQKLGDISGLRKDREGRAVARLFYYNDPIGDQRPLDHRAARLAGMRKCAKTPGPDLAYGFDDAILIGGPEDLLKVLSDLPAVAYVEAIHERQTDDHAQVYYPVAMAVSPPLYAVKAIVPPAGTQPKVMPEEEIPAWVNGRGRVGPLAGAPSESSVLQDWLGEPLMPAPISNFEGLGALFAGFTMTGAPPDTEGDVGPNHYVQWVNSMFAVFDKSTGGVLYGPANGNTLFAPLGGRCASDNNGDPLVMYDRISDRWFMSQLSVSSSPYYQCIAVSQTNNPVTSSWNLYAYSYGSYFNDYGKSGVWPDGYYMMYHMFTYGSSWAGTEVCAFDRAKMLAGQTATQQCFGPNSSYGGLLPSHLQGSALPPAGSPNYFMTFGGSGQLLFWPFHVDWTTPANTTFPFNSPTSITVANFAETCGGSSGVCVPQPGTSQLLDTLGDRLMWRMNYRNFGTYESLVLNHSIQSGAGTGIRWYEIRTPSTTPTVYQQGTFAPADTTWRWMGSVNMDRKGDIAAGYSGASSSLYPSILYAGRLAGDPLGTLPQGEATLVAGTGSQTGGLYRWGDYSTMSVDPVDDCTFWYTDEYLTTNGSFNWHTRIGSFMFPSCTSGCTNPDVPGAPVFSNITSTSLTVNWTDVSNEAGYQVQRCQGSGCTSFANIGTQLAPNTTSDPDSGLSASTTYRYRVIAIAVAGCTDQTGASSMDVTTSCTAAPSCASGPSPANAATGVSTSATLSWTASTGATSYDVYFGTTSSPPKVTTTGNTTYNPGTLNSNTTYYWKIIARNSCGSASSCSVWNFKTACALPACAVNPGPADTSIGISTTTKLTWSAVTGATSYAVYFGTAGNPPLKGTITTTSYTPGTLTQNTQYYWYVLPKNSCGSSTGCGTWTFTTCTSPGACASTPDPANAATGVSLTPSLSWAPVTGAASYDVYFGTTSAPPLKTNTTGTTYAPATLTTNTTYYWKIIARNGCGSATGCSVWHFKTGCPIPTCASNPSPADTSIGISTTTKLTWSAVTGATSYAVYFGTASNPPLKTTVTTASYSPGTLTQNTKYYWYIIPKSTCGSASGCTVWSFTTCSAPACPSNPSPANAASGVSTAPTLTWDPVSEATSYAVYFGTTAVPPLKTTGTGTAYAPGTLLKNTTYYWKIIPKSGCGSATGCVTWSFKTTP